MAAPASPAGLISIFNKIILSLSAILLFTVSCAIDNSEALLLSALALGSVQSADYTLTFTSTWSAATHASGLGGFPSNAHFSKLVGAGHNASGVFWQVGQPASAGIQSMAETGSTTTLLEEFSASAHVQSSFVDDTHIGSSPGTESLTFSMKSSHPLVTIVTMVAPSPDWFSGVNGLNLFENGAFVESKTQELFVYDSGTDSGATFTAANSVSDPVENIFKIQESPFYVSGEFVSIGTFTFTRN